MAERPRQLAMFSAWQRLEPEDRVVLDGGIDRREMMTNSSEELAKVVDCWRDNDSSMRLAGWTRTTM